MIFKNSNQKYWLRLKVKREEMKWDNTEINQILSTNCSNKFNRKFKIGT